MSKLFNHLSGYRPCAGKSRQGISVRSTANAVSPSSAFFVAAFFCHSMPLTTFSSGVGFLLSSLNPSQIRNVLRKSLRRWGRGESGVSRRINANRLPPSGAAPAKVLAWLAPGGCGLGCVEIAAMTMGNPHRGTSSAIWRAGLLRELHKLSRASRSRSTQIDVLMPDATSRGDDL